MSLTKASSLINELILHCSFNPINFSQMASQFSFFKVLSHTFLNLKIGKLPADIATSSIFAFLFIVKLKSLQAPGLIEVFKILRIDSLQLLHTCLAADIFKPKDFAGKHKWLMLPLMVYSTIFCSICSKLHHEFAVSSIFQ